VEAAVLQETGTKDRDFNVLSIDTELGTYEYTCVAGRKIVMSRLALVHQFIRNSLSANRGFISARVLETLNDPALPISHPRKRDVKLDDLFIYPAISFRTFDKPNRDAKMIL